MREIVKKLFLLKFKFSIASIVATAIDLCLFELFNSYFNIEPVRANIFALSIAILVNFILQKLFVFELKRKLGETFLMAIAVSISGIFISSAIIYFLIQWEPFISYPILAKICATGLLFMYNFYLKRYAFEKRFV